jgi:hypothetical protein
MILSAMILSILPLGCGCRFAPFALFRGWFSDSPAACPVPLSLPFENSRNLNLFRISNFGFLSILGFGCGSAAFCTCLSNSGFSGLTGWDQHVAYLDLPSARTRLRWSSASRSACS